jgi:hypothetical protein
MSESIRAATHHGADRRRRVDGFHVPRKSSNVWNRVPSLSRGTRPRPTLEPRLGLVPGTVRQSSVSKYRRLRSEQAAHTRPLTRNLSSFHCAALPSSPDAKGGILALSCLSAFDVASIMLGVGRRVDGQQWPREIRTSDSPPSTPCSKRNLESGDFRVLHAPQSVSQSVCGRLARRVVTSPTTPGHDKGARHCQEDQALCRSMHGGVLSPARP